MQWFSVTCVCLPFASSSHTRLISLLRTTGVLAFFCSLRFINFSFSCQCSNRTFPVQLLPIWMVAGFRAPPFIWCACTKRIKFQACFCLWCSHHSLLSALRTWTHALCCFAWMDFPLSQFCLCWNASRANRSSNFHLILKQNGKQAQGIYIQEIELMKRSRINAVQETSEYTVWYVERVLSHSLTLSSHSFSRIFVELISKSPFYVHTTQSLDWQGVIYIFSIKMMKNLYCSPSSQHSARITVANTIYAMPM